MVDQYVEERRRYISEIKKSFEQDSNQPFVTKMDGLDTVEPIAFPFLKIRFLLAVAIFAAFLYCNFTGAKFYSYSTEDIVTMIEENDFYTKLQDYVMIQMQD